MSEFSGGYSYVMNPSYKDDGVTGLITIKKIEPDTEEKTPREFPVLDVISSEYQFGYTGMSFVPSNAYWDFGDGSMSNLPSPRHTYDRYGYNKVILVVSNNLGETSVIDGLTDHIITLGDVNFVGDPLRGEKPLSVSFEDNSIAPTGYQYTGMQWDFGDTQGSTGQSPTHNYLDYGSYTVQMNVVIDSI